MAGGDERFEVGFGLGVAGGVGGGAAGDFGDREGGMGVLELEDGKAPVGLVDLEYQT